MNGKKAIGSDLRRADALPIAPEQYEEIPELTEQWFEEAELHVGGAKVGRPKSPNRKVPLKLRLDPDVVEAFRATGPGWQTKINAVLRDAIGRRVGARLKRRRRALRRTTRQARRRA
jgi:uncharacterized protein (DUF4415 family)